MRTASQRDALVGELVVGTERGGVDDGTGPTSSVVISDLHPGS